MQNIKKQDQEIAILHKKMTENIEAMKKRSDNSEFSNMNFTQLGDYKIGRHLGSGAYASVKQAIHSATGMLTAIKIYDKFKL